MLTTIPIKSYQFFHDELDELAVEEMRKGFLKLRRTVQERMSVKDPDELSRISDLVNSKSISSAIDFFFGRSALFSATSAYWRASSAPRSTMVTRFGQTSPSPCLPSTRLPFRNTIGKFTFSIDFCLSSLYV